MVTDLINKQAHKLESLEKKVDAYTCHEQLLNKPPLVIACSVCSKPFEKLPDLDDHISANHPFLKCESCDKYLRSIPDLNLHMHRLHPSNHMPKVTSNYQSHNGLFETPINLQSQHNNEGFPCF